MAGSTLRALPLRLRLAIGYATLLVAVIGAVGTFLLAALDSNLEQDVDTALRLRASRVQREMTLGEDGLLSREDVASALLDLAPLEEFSAPGIYVQILGSEGQDLASSRNLPEGGLPTTAEMIAEALAGREALVTVPAGQERIRLLARPVEVSGQVVGVVAVGESLHLLDLTMRQMEGLLALSAVAAVAFALVGGWLLTGRALRPIAEMSRVARRIATTGRFEQRIAVSPARDELGELTITFNEMLDRLQETFRRQREFIGDVSHELRSPLGVICGNLDLLQLDLPGEERRQSAREAALEARHMIRLVSDLLFLAEADDGKIAEGEPVALDEIVSEVWARARKLDEGSHEVVLSRNDPANVLGNRDRLRQLVWNLVENALRYTPADGVVTLSLRQKGQNAELVVSDTGIGMDPEHLPRIFERFYRIDRARSRRQESTGLGLAIVKRVAEMHGGQVQVWSELGHGSTFTVKLPLAPP